MSIESAAATPLVWFVVMFTAVLVIEIVVTACAAAGVSAEERGEGGERGEREMTGATGGHGNLRADDAVQYRVRRPCLHSAL